MIKIKEVKNGDKVSLAGVMGTAQQVSRDGLDVAWGDSGTANSFLKGNPLLSVMEKVKPVLPEWIGIYHLRYGMYCTSDTIINYTPSQFLTFLKNSATLLEEALAL